MNMWKVIQHRPCSKLHALYTGGFPTIRHNEIRDFTAKLMSEVCHDVCSEPPLQPLSGEHLPHTTSNREDNARLDIKAKDFWGIPQQLMCLF